MTTVVLAPDKFKGSLTAEQVCAALAAGLADAEPGVRVRSVPVADGGDGTLAAAVSAGFTRVPVEAAGPTGEPVTTSYAFRDGVAVVELADVSGLARLPGGRLAPLTASSYGTGQVIAATLDAGATQIVLGIGGSACTDGGAGMVEALGARLEFAGAAEIRARSGIGGGGLARVTSVDLSGLHPRLAEVELVVASDVDNPLLGPHGAAAVYGPQKGATPDDVAHLESALRRWAEVVATATGRDDSDRPGAGAAGGVGFGAIAVLGGRVEPGIDLVLELVGLDAALAGADLVVTGEGSVDEQTLRGKAPAGVADRARAHGLPVVAVAGRCLLEPGVAEGAGFAAVHTLSELEPDPHRSMTDAAALLRRLAPELLRYARSAAVGRAEADPADVHQEGMVSG
jgi:glycerate kinase